MNRGKTISSRARTSGSWSCLRPYAACTAAPLDGSGRRAVFRSCLRGVRVAVSLRRTKPGSTELSGFSLAHRRESPLRVDPRAESPGSALGAPSIGRTPGPSAPSQGAYSTNGALVIHRAQRLLTLVIPGLLARGQPSIGSASHRPPSVIPGLAPGVSQAHQAAVRLLGHSGRHHGGTGARRGEVAEIATSPCRHRAPRASCAPARRG